MKGQIPKHIGTSVALTRDEGGRREADAPQHQREGGGRASEDAFFGNSVCTYSDSLFGEHGVITYAISLLTTINPCP